jgi:sec-independent protein translocase protein TatC
MSAKTTETPEAAPLAPEGEVKMTIWEHLEELRRRIIRAALGTLATTIVAWVFRERILEWLVLPYQRAWTQHMPGGMELQTLSPEHVFSNYIELSIVAGIIGAAPVIFYQLWAFVSPGLYKKEKRLVTPFVVFSTALFLSGVAFAYYVVFPFCYGYFLTLLGPLGNSGVVLTQRLTFEYYFDFSTRMLLLTGAVFELPLFLSLLSLAGVVTPKQLLGVWRFAILGAVIVGAVVTPGPDVLTQVVVSAALIALYFVSVGAAYVVARPKAAKAAG